MSKLQEIERLLTAKESALQAIEYANSISCIAQELTDNDYKIIMSGNSAEGDEQDAKVNVGL